MKKIGYVLPDALGEEEILRTARAQTALRNWDLVVGEQLAKRCWPDRYTKGTVWVACQNSAWAQELRLMKEKLLARLQEHCGEPTLIREMRFGVRPLPEHENRTPTGPDLLTKDTPMSIREIADRRLAKLRAEQEG